MKFKLIKLKKLIIFTTIPFLLTTSSITYICAFYSKNKPNTNILSKLNDDHKNLELEIINKFKSLDDVTLEFLDDIESFNKILNLLKQAENSKKDNNKIIEIIENIKNELNKINLPETNRLAEQCSEFLKKQSNQEEIDSFINNIKTETIKFKNIYEKTKETYKNIKNEMENFFVQSIKLSNMPGELKRDKQRELNIAITKDDKHDSDYVSLSFPFSGFDDLTFGLINAPSINEPGVEKFINLNLEIDDEKTGEVLFKNEMVKAQTLEKQTIWYSSGNLKKIFNETSLKNNENYILKVYNNNSCVMKINFKLNEFKDPGLKFKKYIIDSAFNHKPTNEQNTKYIAFNNK